MQFFFFFEPFLKLNPNAPVFSPGRKFTNPYANGFIPIPFPETTQISRADNKPNKTQSFVTSQNYLDITPSIHDVSTPDVSFSSDFEKNAYGTEGEGSFSSSLFIHPEEFGAYAFIYTLCLMVFHDLRVGRDNG